MTWCLIICRSDYCHTPPSKQRGSTPQKAESVDRAVPYSHFQLVFLGCSTSLADNDGLVTQSLMDPHFSCLPQPRGGNPKGQEDMGVFLW